ncbi:MAG TPA: extracellular solute-binding protein [Methylomirabilota bacterium]|nr:extracellular solute-binding protein [Methylomirabilota bacterium]
MTRREVIGRLAALGAGAAVAAAPRRVAAQPAKAPMKLTFWTWENPQQRPWLHKRITQYTEKHPNIKVDFQWFTFTDLGKKVSVGYATGTAPDGFTTGDWLMPTWLARNLIAPLDVKQLGYPSVDAFRKDHADAFIAGAIQDGKVYGYPIWFYGFCNYLNTKQFKEVGLDPERDQPQTYAQLGEVAKRLTIKQGNKFARQGFKFAMHAPQWTMIQFNPIVVQSGGQWFDKAGKCTINNEAGVRAMTVRASIARQYGAEDPADSIATAPLPQMDWLKERCAMFSCHPIPPVAIKSQNPAMEAEGYYRPVQLPGVTADKRYSTCYGFNFVINANAPKDKQEVLHDMYRFVMSDLVDCWQATAPFTLARKSGWTDDPRVKSFPHVQEIIRAKDQGVFFPRTPVWNELADAMHRAVQKVMLNNADIKVALDEAAAEVDRATAEFKKS